MLLRISQRNGNSSVLQHLLQIRISTFIHQTYRHVQGDKHIHQLNNIFVFELSQELDFVNGDEVDALSEPFGFDLFDGNGAASCFLFGDVNYSPCSLAKGKGFDYS